ncbi:TetR/AcrR family transcriptional regulator [Mycobacterium hubeiense]|uniref:TetR/AcrR family transcriptional regulator n=1 Tax=Mycobacterium hubeiense TaxID=1867256 RepID=UPI000C7ECF58|nr:TetR/AcrR family transcriptional regulator [Mycobacterium sp. QGD 101]
MAATCRLLARDGYDQVTIESIAREAEVSRPTVYRRWPSKAHVVFDAVFGTADRGDVLRSSGDFERDLREFIRGVLQFWREPVVARATMGILADRHRDPELFIRTQQLLDEQTRTDFAVLVQTGIDQGRIRRDLDVEMVYDVLVGTTFYSVQVLQREDIEAQVNRLCALVMQGAATKEK